MAIYSTSRLSDLKATSHTTEAQCLQALVNARLAAGRKMLAVGVQEAIRAMPGRLQMPRGAGEGRGHGGGVKRYNRPLTRDK